MPLTTFRIPPAEETAESLTLALQALLRWAGGEASYDDVNAALGLSFMTSVRDPERCLGTWMSEGRDLFLAKTAARFGIRLRELHPPEAALDLEVAPEFTQHFHASYKPLIQRALENDQPVLVCRGWPGRAEALWGLITSVTEEGIGFRGTTSLGDGSPVILTTPPTQAYVVEEIRPRTPPDDELLQLAMDHARVVLRNQVDRRFRLLTGPGAYDAWLERLRQPSVCAVCGPRGSACHQRMAVRVSAARQSALAFFSRHGMGMPAGTEGWPGSAPGGPGAGETVARIVSAGRGVIQALNCSADPQAVRELLQTEPGRTKLAEEVRSVRAHDADLADAIVERCTPRTGRGV